jgi:hypothetical protein
VQPGDRVAVRALDSFRYLELYYGIPELSASGGGSAQARVAGAHRSGLAAPGAGQPGGNQRRRCCRPRAEVQDEIAEFERATIVERNRRGRLVWARWLLLLLVGLPTA